MRRIGPQLSTEGMVFKSLRYLRLVEQLPRTATGKLQRGAVRGQVRSAAPQG